MLPPPSATYVEGLETGAAFTGVGLFDLICSRGRHVGWPLLTGIGIAVLLSLALVTLSLFLNGSARRVTASSPDSPAASAEPGIEPVEAFFV
jgi:hypothetical protein